MILESVKEDAPSLGIGIDSKNSLLTELVIKS